jgi:ATP-dependent DNA helicase DinG|tara:strand:+ start:140 stop:1765 length:1626 start_codon:yes stop_codon:yes gene_type:complete
MKNNISYLDKFPYPSIRDQQQLAIDFSIKSLINDNKKFCIIEAGTGVGKSAIGLTLARVLADTPAAGKETTPGSYFLTTQKILQDQYESDFNGMVSLKSSVNYKCSYHKKNTCSESQALLRTEEKGTRFFNSCAFNCVYKKRKEKFLESRESITNFPYFLTEAGYSGKITKRHVLVIDEAHNVESELSRFVEISVSAHFARNLLNLKFPEKPTQYRVFRWIVDTYLPAICRKISHIERMIEQFGGEKFRQKLSQFQKITRQLDLLSSHRTKIENFVQMYNSENWVFDISRTGHRGSLRATFKPIDVSPYAEESLFCLGEKVIMMSATIMNKQAFCQTLGIDENDCGFITIPSPFEVKNRPVIFSPVGSMSAKNIDKTLPQLSKAVREIMDHHKGEKGIIHCKTFKIAHYIKNNVKSDRFIIHDSTNRDEMLSKHMKSKKDTVLLSPSMTEGVDLKDDTSRFQVICKVPFPYLGDKLVKKRMNKFPRWYNLQTAKTIVQSAGRSVRNKDDHAVTYILDGDFERFLKNNRDLFPKDFLECLVG